MANKFQKILFSLSSSSPILICFSIMWFIQKQTWLTSIIVGGIGLLLSTYDVIFVFICKKIIPAIPININEISPNDNLIWTYIVSYILPIFNIQVDNYLIISTSLTIIILGFILPMLNFILPNPLLRLFGYHFYKASTIDGIKDYCLITNRKEIHNVKVIKNIHNVFGYFLIERR